METTRKKDEGWISLTSERALPFLTKLGCFRRVPSNDSCKASAKKKKKKRKKLVGLTEIVLHNGHVISATGQGERREERGVLFFVWAVRLVSGRRVRSKLQAPSSGGRMLMEEGERISGKRGLGRGSELELPKE